MTNIKLVLTDLDGTAVYYEAHEASRAVLQAIRDGEAKGVKFCAVTGRPFWYAKDLLKHMGFRDPCIFDGGASIANPATGEVLWSKFLPAETTHKAVEMFLPHASVMEYGTGAMTPDDIDLAEPIEQSLSVWGSVPLEIAPDLMKELQKLPDVTVHGNPAPGGDTTRYGIQVTHFQADKELAVHELLSLLNINRDHTLAIGDGDNDLPLFRAAATKVAMGNATDLLKAKADRVVNTVENDGFAEAVAQFILA
jgi:HAD superfamily hydrolase (TIGR01484 family)